MYLYIYIYIYIYISRTAAIKYSTGHGKRVRVSITSLDRHDREWKLHSRADTIRRRVPTRREGNRRRNLSNAKQNSVNEKFVTGKFFKSKETKEDRHARCVHLSSNSTCWLSTKCDAVSTSDLIELPIKRQSASKYSVATIYSRASVLEFFATAKERTCKRQTFPRCEVFQVLRVLEIS